MVPIVCAIIIIAGVVWFMFDHDWGRWCSFGVLFVFALTISSLYFINMNKGISEELKCDRMHGVLIREGTEKSCVERDSIKPIDLDKVFSN